ncbi:MAG: DUF58 domain-containing protein [Clostridia bacterium]|nr:DUF58 domain-containing protein [Clostridia bacterium]
MKDANIKARKDKKIALTGNFAIYVVLFIGALVFTQALRSKASNIFFGFVFALPWVMLIYALTSRLTLKIFMLSESAEVAKNQPYEYKIRLVNESVIPYPFIDAMIWLPQKNSVRCAKRTVKMTMSPRADYTVNNTVCFPFRGTYEIGVDCMYVYDFFRMFRIKVDVNIMETVYVLPRRLDLDIGQAEAVSDASRKTQKSNTSYEKIEISDIREYRSGDALKSIHWKLSSKSEEFMVRDYDTGSSRETYVFCDMSAGFATEPPEKPQEPIPSRKNKKRKSDKAEPTASNEVDGTTAEEVAPVEPVKKSRRARGRNKLEIATAEKREETAVDVNELADDKYYEDMNEYCADGIVELTVSTVLKELRAGCECTLLWFDRRSESGIYCFTLRGLADFNAIFRLFATAPLCDASDSVTRLSAMMKDTQDIKQVYITSAIDPEAVKRLCSMPAVADGAATGAAEVILYDPEERFAHINERKLYIEGCREQLASRGLRLTQGRLD